MGLEAELKFRVPPRSLERVETWRLPGGRQQTQAQADLVSTYFDTPKQKLRRYGLSLRVRRNGQKYIQTVKSASDGRFGRGEWEAEVESNSPDLAKADGSPLEELVSRRLNRKLKPVFQTSVHRITLPINRGGSEIELAIDRGKISVGRRSIPVEELELELRRGEPRDLFEVANAIAHKTEAELYLRSKSERGYDLASRSCNSAVFAQPVKVDRHMRASEAFRTIARSTIRHFSGNADAVRNHDAEGVHQMRVGLRRLRAVISLFSRILVSARAESVKRELKWLTRELAPARELDVFLKETIRPAAANSAPRRGIRAIEEEFVARRAQALERARTAVSGKRFRMLLLDVTEWVEREDSISGGADIPIRKFAAKLLRRRVRNVRREAENLERLSDRARHKLRIKAKKLRYAAEFFEALFPGKRRRKRLAKLVKHAQAIQDALGSLNDYLAHRKMAMDAALGAPLRDRRARAFASGILVGREDQATRPLAGGAVKEAGRLKAP